MQPGFNFGASAPPPNQFGFGQGAAPAQQQQQQPAAGFQFNPLPAQQQPASAFTFGQAPAPQQQPPSGFGGMQQPPPGLGFGQQPQQQPMQQPGQASVRSRLSLSFGTLITQPQQQQQPPAFAGGFGSPTIPSPGGISPQFGTNLSGGAPPFAMGAPAAAAPAMGSTGGFGFGAAAPATGTQAPAPSPANFSFGAGQPPAENVGVGLNPRASPFGGGTTAGGSSSGFGFGAPAGAAAGTSTSFGNPQQHQQPPSTGFGFGSAAVTPSSTTGVASQQPFGGASAAPKFDFGAAAKQQQSQQQQPRSQQKPSRQKPPQQSSMEGADTEEEEFDYEAEKRRALANMPSFGGAASAGGGVVVKPPPPPPPRPASGNTSTGTPTASAAAAAVGGGGGFSEKQSAMQRLGGRGSRGGGGSAGNLASVPPMDAVEVARRSQRAARFAPVASTPTLTPGPEAAAAPSPFGTSTFGKSPSAGSLGTTTSALEDDSLTPGDNLDDDGDLIPGHARTAIVGICEDMCPPAERERRQNMNDIQIFERVDPNNSSLTSPALAVRRFARTVDDPQPPDFRTRGALKRTMDHLRSLLDKSEYRFGLVHKFLWDRYRSVRQDLYIQGIQNEFAVEIYEEIVRFHVLCEHELCAEDQSVTDMEGFNTHLNVEQMNKSLISLNEMYNNLTALGRPQASEAEFRAYHLLSLMGAHGKYKGDQQSFLSTLQTMRAEVRESPAIKWVLDLQRAFAANNFVKFFGLLRGAPYLLACMAHCYFPNARKRALVVLTDTMSPSATKPVPLELSYLKDTLMMDSLEEVQELCIAHGLETGMDGTTPIVLLVKGANNGEPPAALNRRPSYIISSLALPTRGESVTTPFGCTLGINLLAQKLTPEQIAAMEEQKRAALVAQREAAERARAAAAAEGERARQAMLLKQATEEQAKREMEERMRREEEERMRLLREKDEEERRKVEEERRREEMRRQEEARKAAEAEAEQRRLIEEARQREEAARRAAAEAEARRLQAERLKREAEEAERQRLAELERQRIAELRRQEEERKRKAEEARVKGIERRFFAFWTVNMRKKVAERRRKEKIAASLKACRVGAAPLKGLTPEEMAAVEDRLHDLDIEEERTKATSTTAQHAQQQQKRRGVDLASIVAPFLMQKNPTSKNLLWKLVLVSPPLGSSNTSSNTYDWLQVQLSLGKSVPTPNGSAYATDPVELSSLTSQGEESSVVELKTCVAVPRRNARLAGTAFAGASGLLLVLDQDSTSTQIFIQSSVAALPEQPALPVLIVAEQPSVLQRFEQSPAGQQLLSRGSVKLISLAPDLTTTPTTPPSTRSSKSGATNSPADGHQQQEQLEVAYRRSLLQGLRWLAANTPSQPALIVAKLEDIARDAVAAVTGPVLESMNVSAQQAQQQQGGSAAGSAFFGQRAGPHDMVAAYGQALTLVEQTIKKAGGSEVAGWSWPPPEICAEPLKHWQDSQRTAALLAAMEKARVSVTAAYVLPPNITVQEVAEQLHLRLSSLSSPDLPLVVLPAPIYQEYRTRIEQAAAAVEAQLRQPKHRLLADSSSMGEQPPYGEESTPLGGLPGNQQRSRSSSPLRQKRKWKQSPESGLGLEGNNGRAIQAAAESAHQRLKSGLASLQSRVEAARNAETHFQANLLGVAHDMGGIAPVQNTHGVVFPSQEFEPSEVIDVSVDDDEGRQQQGQEEETSSVLQQLNQRLKGEKEASGGLWRRIRTAATSLF